MNKPKNLILQGSRDYLFEESDNRCKIENTLSGLFEENSYRRVMTSAMEYMDVFDQSTSINPDEMYKLEDKSGTARFFSPLSVDSFQKKSSFIYYDESSFSNAADDITILANAEGLSTHANSIEVRV